VSFLLFQKSLQGDALIRALIQKCFVQDRIYQK
jgi:hypothetical protein